jgi:hypothetical protein
MRAVFLVALVGCAHGSAPARSPSEGGEAILFPAPDFVSMPLVRGTIDGRPTSLMVDTGAGVSVISLTLARELALPITNGVQGIDVAGRPIQLDITERPRMAIDGLGAIADRATAILDLPPEVARAGIGAILSPQMLPLPGEAIEIDFAHGLMRRTKAKPGPHASPVCSYTVNGVAARMLVTDAVVGGIPAHLEIDSGTNRLMLAESTDAGRAIAARNDLGTEPGTGAAGAFSAKTARGVPVRIAEWSGTLAVSLVPVKSDAQCGTMGRLGMERLRSCSLGITETESWLSCGP